MEAAIGIEPMDKGFADLCLTTWLRRRNSQTKGEGPLAGCSSLGLRPKTLERETGFEPATSTLARSHSTAELLPLGVLILSARISFCQPKPFSSSRSVRGSATWTARHLFGLRRPFPHLTILAGVAALSHCARVPVVRRHTTKAPPRMQKVTKCGKGRRSPNRALNPY